MEKKNMKALLRVVADCKEVDMYNDSGRCLRSIPYVILMMEYKFDISSLSNTVLTADFLSSARVLSTTSRIFDCFRNADVNYFPSNTVGHTDMMQDAVTQELFSSRPGLQSGSTPYGDILCTFVCQSALPALNLAYLCLDSDGCVIRPEVISFPNRTEETRRQRHLPAEYLGDHAQIAQQEVSLSATIIHEVMHVLEFDAHAFTHSTHKKRRRRQVNDNIVLPDNATLHLTTIDDYEY
ncbi:hypothetical protein Tco_0934037 [Tanacetum coccineum]